MTDTARKKFNLRICGELLLDALPRPIETEAENERALAVVDRLMSKGEDNLTPEETTLLELLVQLIERFEEKAYPIPDSPGYRVLQTSMENRDVKQADLLPRSSDRWASPRRFTTANGRSTRQGRKSSANSSASLRRSFSKPPQSYPL
jgi:antitoxin component HigA of HigAB toxin-antitoxin module